jgi:polysaccharide deacetylase 2 family uncharacterized protein YibQ
MGLLKIAMVISISAGAGTPVYAQSSIARIAIIIDDLGYLKSEGRRALALPGALTFAVLPHTPYANIFAAEAHEDNKEVVLHLPMESERGNPLGPGGITTQMTRSELVEVLMSDLDAIPYVSGVSNHMGSLLSASEVPVGWVMTAVKQRDENLFFVDSRTTPHSVISRIARKFGVPHATRDVFLDHTLSTTAISRQFELLVAHAKRHGSALGIAHPHRQTLEVLERLLPQLQSYGVKLVPVSDLIGLRLGQVAFKASDDADSL